MGTMRLIIGSDGQRTYGSDHNTSLDSLATVDLLTTSPCRAVQPCSSPHRPTALPPALRCSSPAYHCACPTSETRMRRKSAEVGEKRAARGPTVGRPGLWTTSVAMLSVSRRSHGSVSRRGLTFPRSLDHQRGHALGLTAVSQLGLTRPHVSSVSGPPAWPCSRSHGGLTARSHVSSVSGPPAWPCSRSHGGVTARSHAASRLLGLWTTSVAMGSVSRRSHSSVSRLLGLWTTSVAMLSVSRRSHGSVSRLLGLWTTSVAELTQSAALSTIARANEK